MSFSLETHVERNTNIRSELFVCLYGRRKDLSTVMHIKIKRHEKDNNGLGIH